MLLLRQVNDFNRTVESEVLGDPRELDEFKKLDELTKNFRLVHLYFYFQVWYDVFMVCPSFRSSFPPAFRNPMKPSNDEGGKAVDESLLAAHTNACISIIQLHEKYSGSSNERLFEAARMMVGFVHHLQATNFEFSFLYSCKSVFPLERLCGVPVLTAPALSL